MSDERDLEMELDDAYAYIMDLQDAVQAMGPLALLGLAAIEEGKPTGWVYYLEHPEYPDAIKIGFTTDLQRRIKRHRSALGAVRVLAVEAGDKAEESRRHRQFGPRLATPDCPGGREWFRRTEALVEHLDGLELPGSDVLTGPPFDAVNDPDDYPECTERFIHWSMA